MSCEVNTILRENLTDKVTSMTVDEEMGDARAVVNKWLSG